MSHLKYYAQRATIGVGCGFGVFVLIQAGMYSESLLTVKTELFYIVYWYVSIVAGILAAFMTAILWD